jgi:hypothetical protein
VNTPENLPARVEAGGAVEPHEQHAEKRSLIPSIPDVGRTAARWIRPFVPPIVGSVIDTTTKPLRGARQVVEETEEVHFSHKRTRKMTVYSEDD